MDNLKPLVVGSNASFHALDWLSTDTTFTTNETYRKTGTTKGLYYYDSENRERKFSNDKWTLLTNLFVGTHFATCQWYISIWPGITYNEFFGDYDMRAYPIDEDGNDLGTNFTRVTSSGYQKYKPATASPALNEVWGTWNISTSYATYSGIMNGVCIDVNFDVRTPWNPPNRPTIYSYNQGLAVSSYATNVNRYED